MACPHVLKEEQARCLGAKTPGASTQRPRGRCIQDTLIQGRRASEDRLAHEDERAAARLAAVLHVDHPAGGADVARGGDVLALAGRAPALSSLGQLGILGRRHGAAS